MGKNAEGLRTISRVAQPCIKNAQQQGCGIAGFCVHMLYAAFLHLPPFENVSVHLHSLGSLNCSHRRYSWVKIHARDADHSNAGAQKDLHHAGSGSGGVVHAFHVKRLSSAQLCTSHQSLSASPAGTVRWNGLITAFLQRPAYAAMPVVVIGILPLSALYFVHDGCPYISLMLRPSFETQRMSP